jgi:hypothetical protein
VYLPNHKRCSISKDDNKKGIRMIRQKIQKYAMMLATALLLIAPSIIPAGASAQACGGDNTVVGSVTTGIQDASGNGNGNLGCDTGTTDNSTIASLAKKVINIISLIVGAAAVLFIIYGGFRYITSGGDSGNVSNAKNTIIYALVGLIIVALAQFLVHYVINTAINSTGGGA